MKIRGIITKITFFARLVFLLLLINSCNNSDKSANSPNVDGKEGFIKIIPNSRNGLPSFAYKETRGYSRQAGLHLIENGFDSLFIRIWYLNDTIQVLDFKNEHGVWTGVLHKLMTEQNNDSIRIIKTTSEKISPKSGWPYFIDNLFSQGIITLPDISELPVYGIPTHGFFLDVEVATRTKYRIYTYGIPEQSIDIMEVSNIMDIMKLIENEFGILSLHKYYFQ